MLSKTCSFHRSFGSTSGSEVKLLALIVMVTVVASGTNVKSKSRWSNGQKNPVGNLLSEPIDRVAAAARPMPRERRTRTEQPTIACRDESMGQPPIGQS